MIKGGGGCNLRKGIGSGGVERGVVGVVVGQGENLSEGEERKQ